MTPGDGDARGVAVPAQVFLDLRGRAATGVPGGRSIAARNGHHPIYVQLLAVPTSRAAIASRVESGETSSGSPPGGLRQGQFRPLGATFPQITIDDLLQLSSRLGGMAYPHSGPVSLVGHIDRSSPTPVRQFGMVSPELHTGHHDFQIGAISCALEPLSLSPASDTGWSPLGR